MTAALIVGFTGTRAGMSLDQQYAVWQLLHARAFVAMHGCCVGADVEFDAIARSCPGLRHVHMLPCNVVRSRAFMTPGPIDVVDLPVPPLERDRTIATVAHVLIAAPREPNPNPRSGTWATIRYARQVGTPIAIVLPDGSVWDEGYRNVLP